MNFKFGSIKEQKIARLKAEVLKTQNQLFLIKSSSTNVEPWMKKAEEGLASIESVAQNDTNLAWQIFKSYRRMIIEGFSETEVKAEIKYLLNYTSMLNENTSKTIKDLFPANYDSQAPADLKSNLIYATTTKDNYFDEFYNNLNLSQTNARKVLWAFLIAIATFTILYSIAVHCFHINCFLGSPKYLITIEIFGYLGAIFSIVTRFTNDDPESIKSSLQDTTFPLVRSCIGPGAALIMFLFVHSHVINDSFFKLNDSELAINKPSKIDSTIAAKFLDSLATLKAKNQINSKKDSLGKTVEKLQKSDTTKSQNNVSKLAKIAKCKDCEKNELVPNFLMLILAFLAGFSEKLVVKILDRMSNKVK